MSDLLRALSDPDFGFLRIAFLMGLLASVAFGATGSFVVVKRISYVAGAISHAVLGGIGFSLYAQYQYGWDWLSPMTGALIAALLAALVISWVKHQQMEREDSVIGAVWATGMALGLVFMSAVPSYVNPMSYLFGNILLLSVSDLWIVLIVDAIILLILTGAYAQFQATSYDPEFSKIRGTSPALFETVLLILVALTIVLLVSIVGVIMVVALLTLPAAIASRWTLSLHRMMIYSSLISLVFIWSGLSISYVQDWPTGPSIILIAGSVYLVFTLIRVLRKRFY